MAWNMKGIEHYTDGMDTVKRERTEGRDTNVFSDGQLALVTRERGWKPRALLRFCSAQSSRGKEICGGMRAKMPSGAQADGAEGVDDFTTPEWPPEI